MNSKIIFIILIFAIKFNAIFGQLSCSYGGYNMYVCDLTISNPNGLNNFGSIGGTHVSGYTDSDVTMVMTVSGSISTNIPSIICSKFTNVQMMIMEAIGIQRIDDYSFIGCTAMTYLSLYNNQITTVHERAFNRNLNLQSLYLYYNRLTTLPENVFQFQQKLNKFWFDQNNIADLPGKIFYPLTSLESLHFSNNQIRNIRPEWFERSSSIKDLYMPRNFISDLPKNAFSQLKNLVSLDVSGNSLKMIHADSFGFLSNLREIYLFSNQLDAIDENLIDYTGVTYIDMRWNFCANKQISDTSISRDVMRAELRECFNNYERTMSVCRQHSKLFIESDKPQTCTVEKQVIREMKEAWGKEKEELMATIKQLSTNKQKL